jgi:Triose-phosphate Transporter family
VTTIISFLLLLPFVFVYEGSEKISTKYAGLKDKDGFLLDALICGMCFYLYNEVQNLVLASLGPVPTAVGNTLKRVAIFVALYLFTEGETFPQPKVVGCAVAIFGCLLYAVCDSKKW